MCSLAATQQSEGLRVDYLPIILDIGMLDPVFQWALSMNSEEHRACVGVLMALAEAAPLLAGVWSWSQRVWIWGWGLRVPYLL